MRYIKKRSNKEAQPLGEVNLPSVVIFFFVPFGAGSECKTTNEKQEFFNNQQSKTMDKQDKQNCYILLYRPFPTSDWEEPEVIKVKDRQTLDRLISSLCHACGTSSEDWGNEIEYLKTIDDEVLEEKATRLCIGGKLDWRENELILETEEICKFHTSYFKTRYIVGKQGDYVSNLYVSNVSEEHTKQKE